MDEFTQAYIIAALFSSTDDHGQPLDVNHSPDDIDPATKLRMMDDCTDFQRLYAELIAKNPTQAGHDFWLTRNGHGCGFWDADWAEEAGEQLTQASEKVGSFTLYVGDDGHIYGMNG